MAPATGHRRGFVLVTRPRIEARRTANLLKRRGWQPVVAPALEVQRLPGPPPKGANDAEALIVTSTNALRGLPDGWIPSLAAQTLAVGDRTTRFAAELGLPRPASAGGDAGALLILCAGRLAPGQPVLQLCGEGLGNDLTAALSARGHPVMRWETYRTVPARRLVMPVRWLLGRRRAAGVLLLSPFTANAFACLVDRHGLWGAVRNLRFACISLATAESLLDSAGPKPLLNVCIAQEPDLAHSIDALADAGAPGRPSGSGNDFPARPLLFRAL